MAFEIDQKVWAKPIGRHGYHCATIVIEVNNGEAFLVRRKKDNWNNNIVKARDMRSFIASMGMGRTVNGVRYHNADMADNVPH